MKKKDAVSLSNSLKTLSGLELDNFIEQSLLSLEKEEVIRTFERKVNFKHNAYAYEKQFLANFLIETLKGKYIVVRSSNSFRIDRAKIGFYDFEGIIRYSSFSKEIIATVYLVPDSELDNSGFISTRSKIINREFYCPATHLLTLSEFLEFLEGHKYSVLYEEIEEELVVSDMTLQDQGSFYGKSGNDFEKTLVEILSDNKNLIQLKTGNKTAPTFKLIVEKILGVRNLLIDNVVQINATNSVPPLKNGGTPKTDIILYFQLTNPSQSHIETISVKKTTKNRVSCHDYKAVDFIRVLACENTRLAAYLENFQKSPTLKSFREKLEVDYSEEEFSNLLYEKRSKFTQWVLRGMYDVDNLIQPELQVSNFIFIKQMEKLAFYEMEEYISLITTQSKQTFGVPFSWTYPSKQRGKRIQLKMPVIM